MFELCYSRLWEVQDPKRIDPTTSQSRGLPYRQDENILSLWSPKVYDRREKAVPSYHYSYPWGFWVISFYVGKWFMLTFVKADTYR